MGSCGMTAYLLRPMGNSLHHALRHSRLRPPTTLRASSTMRPATMALVVAMAWMMLPAMPLASKRERRGMPNEWLRKLEAAVTKSTAK